MDILQLAATLQNFLFPLLFSVTPYFVAHKTPGSGLSPQDESLSYDCAFRPRLPECSQATMQEEKLVVERHKTELFGLGELSIRYFLPSDQRVLYFAKI